MSKTILFEISFQLQKLLGTHNVNVNSAMSIIAKATELVSQHASLSLDAKKQMVYDVIALAATGQDGVLNTADDLIPEKTMTALRSLLEGDVIQDTWQVLHDAHDGKFNLQHIQETATVWSKICMGCFGK